ncbi:ankyrin repeat domain-containing protein [Rickettsia sp. TH2014]|uniref:ankyrin repeat domain-containing protein n=1 Tax=Rickettsia sp. TH2014 TaxID=1967503 RepID=UPI001C467D86|nr:ankyrin repeat domain-containing protein [Rickettsia sp. TH2014]
MGNKKTWFKQLINAITCDNIHTYHKVIKYFTKDEINKLRDKAGNTLLHLAIINRNSIILEDLIKKEIDLNVTTQNGSTALHLSIETFQENSIPIIEHLLTRQIDVNTLNKMGRTAIDLVILDSAIDTEEQKTKIVKLFLENYYNLVITKEHFTILHTCAAKGYLEIVELLINKVNIDIRDDEGWTMLHLAIKNNHHEIVQLLLKHHANITIYSPEGLNAIQAATKECNLKIINSLLKYCDTVDDMCSAFLINLANTIMDYECGRTLQHIAADENYAEIIRLLLRHNIDMHCKDTTGRIPMHLAAESGNIAIIKEYIAHNVDINIQDAYGMTPLHCAIRGGNYTVISILLKQGCKINISDHNSITAHHLLTHTTDLIMYDIFRSYSNAQVEDPTLKIVGGDAEIGSVQISV